MRQAQGQGPSKRRNDDENDDTNSEPLPKRRAISGGSTSLSKYKQNLTYDPLWRKSIPGWMYHMIMIQVKLVV